ncbi:TPM domain-containing protein, partial [Bordetella sp. 02P26C-1]|uniref:TPM domain-containing protein n=1 Tax=Bordetella sp. 02P26C-1 TaxID=2683195 RepID=UPI003FA415EB
MTGLRRWFLAGLLTVLPALGMAQPGTPDAQTSPANTQLLPPRSGVGTGLAPVLGPMQAQPSDEAKTSQPPATTGQPRPAVKDLADAPADVPQLRARVTDMTGKLDATRRQALEQQLAALEQRKGAQVAVLLVPSTGQDTIEQYATRVFDAWRLGRKDTDDGVLLVVATDDRALRIEVGYGLEGAIPDVMAGRIIREQIVPRFQAGDMAGGVEAGVAAIEKLVDGEALPPPAPTPTASEELPMGELALPFLLGMVVLILGASTIFAGVGAALVSWFVFGSVGAALIGGVAGFAISGLLGVLGFKKLFREWLRR